MDQHIDGPGGLQAEVIAGHLRLDFADGTWAEVEIPKARWRLSASTRELGPPEFLPDTTITFGEHWWGFTFHPLELLDKRAAFRITHHTAQRETAEG